LNHFLWLFVGLYLSNICEQFVNLFVFLRA
jgi:hypothetical protein